MSHVISNTVILLFMGCRGCLSRFQAVEYDGRFFVNPGSATGAWTGLWNGCVPHCSLAGPLIGRTTLTWVFQGTDAFICAHGHSRSSGCNVCVSIDRGRGSGGENRVPEGCRATSECRITSTEHPEQSIDGSAAAECVVMARELGCWDTCRVLFEGWQRETTVVTINVRVPLGWKLENYILCRIFFLVTAHCLYCPKSIATERVSPCLVRHRWRSKHLACLRPVPSSSHDWFFRPLSFHPPSNTLRHGWLR